MNTLREETADCTEKCRSEKHGNIICSALTKRDVCDLDLCSYLYYTCNCCESVRDESGRLALHVAASCGKINVVKWLLEYKRAYINAKDFESGYTALHRSIFYGKLNVAVCLIKLGANASLIDANGLTMIEHAMKDQKVCPDIKDGEIYAWGSNANYTLGPQQARSVPELMDTFHKEYPQVTVKQICLNKFHCIIVTTDGKVFSCGHGQGGRLGLSTEHSVLNPKPVQFLVGGHTKPVVCLYASIGRDHSLFLTEAGNASEKKTNCNSSYQIWSCGLNTYRVLGFQPPPSQILEPKPLNLLQYSIKEVCAARYHSVAWGPEGLYTWGLHAGQLGHDKTSQKFIISPKLVSNFFGTGAQLIAVAASNGATAIATSKGDVYLLHEYQRRRIASRILNIVSISIIGGELDTSIDNALSNEKSTELKVAALTDTGNLLLWQQTDPQLSRCIFSLNRLIKVKQATLNISGIVFVTNEGEAFQGCIKQRKKKNLSSSSSSSSNEKSAFHKFLEKDDCVMVKLIKIPHIHRAISIQSDLKGGNFAVLQSSPRFYLTQVPEISPVTMQDDLKVFFNEGDISDPLHDIVFKVSNKLFPAHKFIVTLNSAKIEKLLMDDISDVIEIKDVEAEIFEQLLLYMYCHDCDLVRIGPCPQKLVKFYGHGKGQKNTNISNENENCTFDNESAYEIYNSKKHKNKTKQNTDIKIKDPVRLLQEAAKKYGVVQLQKLLDNFCYDNGFIRQRKDKAVCLNDEIKFDQSHLPEYHDIIIKSKNGREFKAHRCVLAARLEYFNSMFSTRWNENNSCNVVTVPFTCAVVKMFIQFLYTDEDPISGNEDLENIYNLLILADQFFIIRLKEICEYALSTLLTLKNVAQFLSFAYIYNAHQLKVCCMEFICLNLSSILESQVLNNVDEKLLDELTEFYYEWNPIMSQRVITPYSTAPPDEVVTAFKEYPIPEEESCEIKAMPKNNRRKHRHRNSERNSFTLSESKNNDNETETEVLVEIKTKTLPRNISESIPIRLRAITLAQGIIQSEDVSHDFSKLRQNSDDSQILSSSYEDFPLLNSPPSGSVYSKSPHKHEKCDKTKIVRMSQKQRKRLSSESLVKENNDTILPEPRNPWKINTNVSPVESPGSVNAIITEEKKQKENFTKMRSKLLLHTQMEDKAIEELLKFYNADNVFDEILTVDRVKIGIVASPVWVHKSKQSS